MVVQGFKQMPEAPLWLARLSQAVFWTLWMMSPLPLDWAQPTLRLLADLRDRGWTWLWDASAKNRSRTKPGLGKWRQLAN